MNFAQMLIQANRPTPPAGREMPEHGEWVTCAQLARKWGIKVELARYRVKQMVEHGLLQEVGEKPYEAADGSIRRATAYMAVTVRAPLNQPNVGAST